MPTGPVLPFQEKTGSADWAVRQAQTALEDRRFAAATVWLHRAARLLPEDPTIQLMLASALAHADPAAAIGILQALTARRPDDRDAALALIATLLRANRAADAAACLAGMLGRMAPPDTGLFRTVAGGVCQGAGAQGWMWLDGNGTCFVRLAADAPAATIALELDGTAMGSVRVRPGRQAAVPLPEGWRAGRRLVAAPDHVALLGSGLSPAWFGRVEGYASVAPGGTVQGWARLPADPGTRPVVFLRRTDGTLHAIAVERASDQPGEDQPERWRFKVLPGALAGEAQAEVVDAVGRSLWGSPIPLGGEQIAARRAAQSLAVQSLSKPCNGQSSSADPFRPLPTALLPATPQFGARSGAKLGRVACDVIVPVHGGAAELEVCLASLTAFLPSTSRLVLVNDGSPDPAIAARLRSVAGGRVTLLEHAQARGFPAAVNAGLAHLRPVAGRDVVILNADTAVGRHWLARLSAVAHSDPAIGSCTPLTNDGTIVSYPTPGEAGDAPGPAALAAINRLCWEANGAAAVPIPTGVGFCMLMKGACIAETGFFREDVFAQGYGEENDWCLRAAHLGWRHAAAPGVFVAHSGGRSFGGAKSLLMERNAAVLERLHPGYGDHVTAAIAAEPLLAARRRIDRLALLQSPGTAAVALVTHDAGGGVARYVAQRCAAIAASGRRPIVLSPQEDTPGLCLLALGSGKDARRLPNLRFTLPDELDGLAAVLRDAGVAAVEIHHLLNHDPSVSTLPALLGVPYSVTVHDYGHWCPRFSLTSRGNRYCGEPLAVADCEECIADLGSRYPAGGHGARLAGAVGTVAGRGAPGHRGVRGRRRADPPPVPLGHPRHRGLGGSDRAGPQAAHPRRKRDSRGGRGRHRHREGLRRAARLRARCGPPAPAAALHRGRLHHRRQQADGDGPGVRDRPVHGRRGPGTGAGAGRGDRVRALRLPRDLVFRPLDAVAVRPVRAGVRAGGAGRPHRPFRPGLAAAAGAFTGQGQRCSGQPRAGDCTTTAGILLLTGDE